MRILARRNVFLQDEEGAMDGPRGDYEALRTIKASPSLYNPFASYHG